MTDSVNLLTVDCEEWFVAEALAGKLPREQWESLPSTVVRNSQRLLDLLYKHKAKATWFVLGWVADRHRELLREITNAGHEIACHSYYHRRVDSLTEEEFRRDTSLAVEAIANAVGYRPLGYRAPSWSVNPSVPWVMKVLADFGFEYDSSIFPIKHDLYGMPQGPRHTFKIKVSDDQTLHEIPASTIRLFGRNIPIAGGGYLRHTPYWYTRQVVRRLNRKGHPAVVYIHPWELDPNPPPLEGLSMVQRLRTYGSTEILLHKLDKMLSDFEFSTMIDYLAEFKRKPIGFY